MGRDRKCRLDCAVCAGDEQPLPAVIYGPDTSCYCDGADVDPDCPTHGTSHSEGGEPA